MSCPVGVVLGLTLVDATPTRRPDAWVPVTRAPA